MSDGPGGGRPQPSPCVLALIFTHQKLTALPSVTDPPAQELQAEATAQGPEGLGGLAA